MSRRQFLAGSLALAGVASIGSAASSPARKCRPLIAGSLWWYSTRESARWGLSGWRDDLEQQAAIGFNLLWIPNAQAAFSTDEDTVLFGRLMDLCAKRKLRVILGMGATRAWYQQLDLQKELAECGKNITRIADRFKSHPAFWAWYIPHEIYMFWGQGDTYIQQLYPGLVERCKRAADLPVTLSPFFILDRDKVYGDFRFNEPEEYAHYWAGLIRKSGLDIIMLQDSGEHFSYVTNAQRRPMFQAMSEACRRGGAKFWGNVESAEFECPSKEEYVKRYGRVHHSTVKNAPWRPVPIGRLGEKLDLAAEYCEGIVTWGYQEFCRPILGDAAKKWYADYQNYYRSQR
jgi:hypothetical protein